MYTLTHSNGETFDMPWRRGKSYSNTLCSFLYNLPRAERANWTLTRDGKAISLATAINAAAKEMNAIRNGYRQPAEPQF